MIGVPFILFCILYNDVLLLLLSFSMISILTQYVSFFTNFYALIENLLPGYLGTFAVFIELF
jgi:hypothetical protein